MKVEDVINARIEVEKNKKYHVLFVPTLSSAIAFYRMEQFVLKLREDPQISAAYTYHNPNYTDTCKWEWHLAERPDLIDEFDRLCQCADLIIFQSLHSEQSIGLLKAIKDKYDIPVLSEFDDDPYSLASSHPAYDAISPGSKVEACTDEQIKLSDGLIVTNSYLRKTFKPKNKAIYVMPNCIDLDLWSSLKPYKKKDDLIRIGYTGGANHADDLEMLYEPMKAILKLHKNVRFVLYYGGEVPSKFHMRGVSIKDFRHWTSIKDYPQKLKSLGFDIGLIPLRDRQFNRCKSNIKYLEYSAMSIPTIASPVEPYKGSRALFAKSKDEWVGQISELVSNKELRESLGRASYNHMAATCNLQDISKAYGRMIKTVCNRSSLKRSKS